MIISIWIPGNEGNFLTSSVTISFSRRLVTVQILVGKMTNHLIQLAPPWATASFDLDLGGLFERIFCIVL
jgi:hypothetical protein